mmetsp:Transcript_1212/g.3512  ORF Transcript_1212/g.3512 Transcript_1212/m.3512 type:complete len:500 (+) Transcript_1212:281-1780(+)
MRFYIVLGIVGVYTLVPALLIVYFRNERIIRIRNVKLLLEFVLLSGAYSGATFALSTGEPVLTCPELTILTGATAVTAFVSCILFYRHIFIRYRAGASDVIKSTDTDDRWWRISMKYCVERKTFVRDARIVEVLCLGSVFGVVLAFGDLSSRPTSIKNCAFNPEYLACVGINVTLFNSCMFLGKGIVSEFNRLAKNGDALGIKRTIVVNSYAFLFGVYSFCIALCALVIDGVPVQLYSVPTLSSAFLHITMGIFPVAQVLAFRRHRKHLTLDSVVENGTRSGILHSYIHTSEGYERLSVHLKQNLCQEGILFLRDARRYEELFKKKRRGRSKPWRSREGRDGDSNETWTSPPSVISSSTDEDLDEATASVATTAKEIFQTYLDPEAPLAINVEDSLRRRVDACINNGASFSLHSCTHPARPTSKQVTPIESVSTKYRPVQEELGSFPRYLFHEIVSEQLELLVMNNLQEFLDDPENATSWEAHCSELRDLDAFESLPHS